MHTLESRSRHQLASAAAAGGKSRKLLAPPCLICSPRNLFMETAKVCISNEERHFIIISSKGLQKHKQKPGESETDFLTTSSICRICGQTYFSTNGSILKVHQLCGKKYFVRVRKPLSVPFFTNQSHRAYIHLVLKHNWPRSFDDQLLPWFF